MGHRARPQGRRGQRLRLAELQLAERRRVFDATFTKSRFNEQPGVEALQFYIDLVYKQKAMTLAPPTSGFDNKLIAMTIASSAPWHADQPAQGRPGRRAAARGKEAGHGSGRRKPGHLQHDQEQGRGLGVRALDEQRRHQPALDHHERVPAAPQVGGGFGRLPGLFEEGAARQGHPGPDAFRYSAAQHTGLRAGLPEIGLAVEEAVFGNKDAKTVLDAAAKKVDALLKQ